MPIEVRFVDEQGVERRSSPARDVAYFWPQLVKLTVIGLEPGKIEPWLQDYLDFHEIGGEELCSALAAYLKFCELALSPELGSPKVALEKSGFLACHPAAQTAVCAKLGQIVTGAFWAGIRSSTPDGKVPPTVSALAEHAETAVRELSKPKRRGWLSLLPPWWGS
jgi:hypothetical protein